MPTNDIAVTPSPRGRVVGPKFTRLKLGVFLAAFGFFLLTSSRERPWTDARPVWEVAESLVSAGTVAIPTRWPYGTPPGRDGKFYALNPLLTSLVHVPGAAIRHVVGKWWPATLPYSWPFASHLAPAALGALACMLFLSLALEHGVSSRSASLGTLALAVASNVWVYARYPYSEIAQAAFFVGFLLECVRVQRDPAPRRALWLGIWGALLVSTKTVYAVALLGPALYLAWGLRDRPGTLLRATLAAAGPLALAVAMYLFYNWLRSGDAQHHGYGVQAALDRGNVPNGLWGMFLSPGKSIFLYSPPLLLALLGLGTLARRHRATLILAAAAALPVIYVNVSLPVWHGDWAWGTRYAVFLTPVAMLPLCFVFQQLEGRQLGLARVRLAALGLVLGAGFVVQIAGNAFYWDHFIRISMEAKSQWLGQPNRAGAAMPNRGGTCDACLEDLYQLHWLPHFQPIRGHLWLLQHVPFGHDAVTAERDAPWHPETTLALNVTASYNRARIDWWALEFGNLRWIAVAIFAVMTMILGAGLWLCRRGVRSAARVHL